MNLSRLFHTLRPIPPQRHLWRLLRRGQRASYSRWPVAARRRFLNSGVHGRVDSEPLLPFARLRADQAASAATAWQRQDAERWELSIHGISRPLALENPCAPGPPDSSYLWEMSAGYLGYSLDVWASGDSRDLADQMRLATAFQSETAWQTSGVFDRQWHPYAASHRLINLAAARCLLATRPDAAPDDLAELDRIVAFHAAYVAANTEYDIHYNHLAKNLMALMVADVLFHGQIRRRRFDAFRRAASRQILPDGGHAELCPMYHNLFLADLLLLRALPDRAWPEGAVIWLDDRIAAMRNAAVVMSFGDGDIALLGDSWRGEGPTTAALAPGLISAPGVTILADTGIARLASGPVDVVIDLGRIGAPDNPGHAHDDCLSLELAIGGQRVICDHGVEIYSAGPARERTRAATSHNGPTYAGAKGMDGWGAFRVGRRAPPPDVERRNLPGGWSGLCARHRKLDSGSAWVERRVMVGHGGVAVIRDRWSGLSPRTLPTLRYLVPKPCADPMGRDLLVGRSGYRLSVTEGTPDLMSGHHFDLFGQARDAHLLLIRPRTMADPGQHGATLVIAPRQMDAEELAAACNALWPDPSAD